MGTLGHRILELEERIMRRNANCTLVSPLFVGKFGLFTSGLFGAAILISLFVFPGLACAQSGTVTDDGFLSSNAMTQQLNLNGHGIALIVAGSNAAVGSTSVRNNQDVYQVSTTVILAAQCRSRERRQSHAEALPQPRYQS
jgi:hypothetical protein